MTHEPITVYLVLLRLLHVFISVAVVGIFSTQIMSTVGFCFACIFKFGYKEGG